MNTKILGIIALIFLYTHISYAQTNKKTDAHITGHVIDSKTKEHIPFVTIFLKGTTIGTAADISGHFLLKNLPLGEHIIVASYTGYHSEEMNIEVVADKTIELKFNLKPQILEMDEVVVTGSRNEGNKRQSAGIVNVLSSKLFEKTASTNMAEVLNFQSGLRVEYSCSNCGVPQLRINGLEGQYSQILLDSRPIFSSLASVYGLEQLPAGMIERVEVIRGGGSALFGSSAIGGVVNIITKEPLHNSASLSNQTGIFQGGGTDINTTLNASIITDDYKAGVYIFGMQKDRSAYDRNKDGFSNIPQINSETLGFRGFYKLNNSSRITAEYHHIKEFRRGGDSLQLPAHQANIAEQLRHNINGGGLKYDYFSPNLKHLINVYTSIQNIDRESYFGTNQNLDAYGTTKDFTFVSGAQYTYSMTQFLFMPAQLTLGGEHTNNQLKDNMLGYNKSIYQISTCSGIYLQNEWKNEQLSLLIGGRLDKHNKIGEPIFSPRLNARYTPITNIGLRASYSSGYRAPQAYEEDLHVAAVGGEVSIITIDPNLRPEYSQSISGSTDLYYGFGGIETNLLIEGFYTHLQDVFTLQENGRDAQGNLLLERRNASGANIRGLNLELKVGFTPQIVLDAGFTLQKSLYDEVLQWSEDPAIAPQKRMFRAPDQYGYLSLNYNPLRQLTTSLTANYTGSMLVQHYGDENGTFRKDSETITPTFWDMGVRFAYDFSLSSQVNLQLSLGVKNILDSFQTDLDRGVLKDAGYIYGPAMPRTYFIGLKLMI